MSGIKIQGYLFHQSMKHLLNHLIFGLKKTHKISVFVTLQDKKKKKPAVMQPPCYVITHIVQLEGDETMKKLCCVSGALRGADDCTVPCTN